MKDELHIDHENAERILEEGWRLFQQKGYKGVSVDEICAACRLSKPTLYYYFNDKETLFVNVLQYKLRGFHHALNRPGTLEERLQSIAGTLLDSFQTEYSTLMRDQEHIKKPENLQKVRQAFHDELFGPLIQLMQSGLDQGELKDENPEILTLIFMGMINFLIGKSSEMRLDNKVLAGTITAYFLDGAKKG